MIFSTVEFNSFVRSACFEPELRLNCDNKLEHLARLS